MRPNTYDAARGAIVLSADPALAPGLYVYHCGTAPVGMRTQSPRRSNR